MAPSEFERLYEGGQLVKTDQKLPALRDGLVPLTVNLKSATPGEIIGFRAKKNSSKIDLRRRGRQRRSPAQML